MDQTCPKCGSEKIIPDAPVEIDQPVYITVYENPQALLFKGSVSEGLHASVCGNCGHTELHVPGFERLWDTYARYLKTGREAH